MVWKAHVNGQHVMLYRWESCPLSVVEIISDTHLRTSLQLKDGSPVFLDIPTEEIENINKRTKFGWFLLWKGRSRLYYNDNYLNWTTSLQRYFGTSQGDRKISEIELAKRMLHALSKIIKDLINRKIKSLTDSDLRQTFVRRAIRNGEEGKLDRLLNILSYTKTSGSAYSAKQYPAGYHTLTIDDFSFPGQRLPSARLDLLPIPLEGMTILDIGCNQGGMLIEAQKRGIRRGIGIDYDPRMVNAANKIRQYGGISNLDFFVFDLEKEQLSLLNDFLPHHQIDMVFLLSICMWIDNWRDVIAHSAQIAPRMLFESNGSDEQQYDQQKCLEANFPTVQLLQGSSEDDADQKKRKLYFCTR